MPFLIRAAISYGRRRSEGTPVLMEVRRQAPSGPEQVAGRIKRLPLGSNLTARQRRGVDQFLKEYDFRQRGGNPNDPFAQLGDTS
jgi:hypothetical protein